MAIVTHKSTTGNRGEADLYCLFQRSPRSPWPALY